jgi:hypothetical protein
VSAGRVTRRETLGQLLPPLLLLLPLAARTGTTLLVGCAFVVAIALFSLGHLAWPVRRAPGSRRLRAVLSVLLAAVVLVLSWWEIAPVHRYADGLAREIQQQCVATGHCPARIGGWTKPDGTRGSTTEFGARVRYAITYRSDGRNFRLCWVVAFGRCRAAEGGVAAPLQPLGPWPWPEAGAQPP